jgi:O-antigen ligase
MKYANQAAGLALTIGLLSYATKKYWLFILLLSGSLFYTYMAGERSDIFSLAAALTALLLIRYKHKMLLALPLAVVVLGLVTLTVTPSTQIEKITNEYLTNNARLDIWTHGFLIAQQDAFLGRGEEHAFTAQERTIYTNLSSSGEVFFSNTFPADLSEAAYEAIRVSYHNQAVQYLVEYGLFGFLIFVMLLIYPFVLAWRRDEYNRTFATGIIIWSAFAMHCLFETSFDNHSVIIIGLLSGLTQIFPDQSSPGQV